MMYDYTKEPKGNVALAPGLSPSFFYFSQYKEGRPGLRMHYLMEEAFKDPDNKKARYHEEVHGGITYEYETYALYHKDTQTMEVKGICCPSDFNHHLGSTCVICGQKD